MYPESVFKLKKEKKKNPAKKKKTSKKVKQTMHLRGESPVVAEHPLTQKLDEPVINPNEVTRT